MKKLKLGAFKIKTLTERELKNVLGGLSADTTVSTSSDVGSTISKGSVDADNSESDADWDAIEKKYF